MTNERAYNQLTYYLTQIGIDVSTPTGASRSLGNVVDEFISLLDKIPARIATIIILNCAGIYVEDPMKIKELQNYIIKELFF